MWPVSKRVSAEGASRLGGSGGMLPRKILNIWLSKTLFPAFSGLKFDNIMYLSSDLHKCKCKCRQTFTRVNSRSVFQGFAPRPESGNYQIPKFWPVSVNRCKPVWIRAWGWYPEGPGLIRISQLNGIPVARKITRNTSTTLSTQAWREKK